MGNGNNERLLTNPRKSRIIRAVNAAAMTPSLTTPLTAALTKSDWSPNCLFVRPR